MRAFKTIVLTTLILMVASLVTMRWMDKDKISMQEYIEEVKEVTPSPPCLFVDTTGLFTDDNGVIDRRMVIIASRAEGWEPSRSDTSQIGYPDAIEKINKDWERRKAARNMRDRMEYEAQKENKQHNK